MDYPGYQHDLDRMLGSEVLGEVLFATAARLSRSDEQRRKWERLRDLEIQTRDRIVETLERHGEHATPPPFTTAKARVFGALLGLLPWSMAMKLLGDGTAPFLEIFERLERHADPERKEFHGYVVAHERAIAEFAARERQARPDASLEPVLALLEAGEG